MPGRRKVLAELLQILIGCILYAVSLVIVNPVSIIPGNVIGLAVVSNLLFSWPVGVINILLTLPTIIAGRLVFGRKILVYTFITMAGVSVLTDWWIPVFAPVKAEHPWMVVLLGALLMGAGCGLIIHAGSTTGGTVIIGRLIHERFPKMTLGNLMLIQDGLIIIIGAFFTGDWTGFIYSIIYEAIVCKIIDRVQMIFISCSD